MKEITSKDHPLVKELEKLVRDARFRKEKKCVVVEGIKMVNELKEQAELIVAKDAALFPSCTCEKILMPLPIIKKISALEEPEGILARLPRPERPISSSAKRVVALDGIGDPGNLGTLFRTAYALGWEGLFLLEGSSDPFNDKALRSAKGATFHLPFEEISKENLIKRAKAEGFDVFGADLKGAPPHPLSSNQKVLLILGSEGKGLSPEMKAFSKPLSLPMREGAESLNVAVAGGILLYLLGGLDESP